MNLYRLVLGENYAVYMFAAVIVGLLSGLVFTKERLGHRASGFTAFQIHALKAGLIVLFLFVIWRESDDLFDALVKASLPIGIYKIVQTFVSLLTAWRADKSMMTKQSEVARHG